MLAGLPVAARARWEAFMTTEVGHKYHSELFRKLAAEHEEVGEARGEGRAVLTVLDARGVECLRRYASRSWPAPTWSSSTSGSAVPSPRQPLTT
jgi:hypothetical protein